MNGGVWWCEGHSTLWEVEGDGMRGVKVSYWQNGQNGQNRPFIPSSHPWPVSPQSTLGWIFPEKPLLESFMWKAVLEESLGCREIAQLVPHRFPPSYKYKYTSIQTRMREIQQLICVIHRPLTNTLTLELNFWKSFGKKCTRDSFAQMVSLSGITI